MASVDDKDALKVTSAGIRLIAILTIFNSENGDRLRQYVADSCHPDLLAEQDADARTAALLRLYAESGKLKVRQVIGVSKEHVIVLLGSQTGVDYLVDMMVGADFPHHITRLSLSPLEDDAEASLPA